MNFLGGLRKRRAIRAYARKLPRMLRADYGFARTYTPHQIKATIERNGLDRDHAAYAVAMFSGPDGFVPFDADSSEHYNYEAMRTEVAFFLFDGNSAFNITDIAQSFSDAGHGFSGGWHEGIDAHGTPGGGSGSR